jgi:hypothetical protein
VVVDPSTRVAIMVTGWPLLMLEDVATTSTMVLPPETIEVVEPKIALPKVEGELGILDDEEVSVWTGDVFRVVASIGEGVGVGIGVGEVVGDRIWVVTLAVVNAVVVGEGEGDATLIVPGESS